MSTLLKGVLDRIATLPEPEQDRLAHLLLTELETAPPPYRVKAWDFGAPLDLTKEELDVYAYGTKEEVAELDRKRDEERAPR